MIVAGVGLLVLAMSTCRRLSLMKLVPLRAHAMIDLAVGALLVASPFLFGLNDDSGAEAGDTAPVADPAA